MRSTPLGTGNRGSSKLGERPLGTNDDLLVVLAALGTMTGPNCVLEDLPIQRIIPTQAIFAQPMAV
eukprot:2239506-Pyramimonas_sp.AAC.1